MKIPKLGLGTWKLTGKECEDVVSLALKLGYEHIDTAEVYGNESEVGKAISESNVNRADLFIVSKVWPEDDLDEEGVVKACEQSLKRLDLNYLDLYLLHWPNNSMNLKSVMKGFKTLQEKGKIKFIGVSNFGARELKEVLRIAKKLDIKIFNNQIECNYLDCPIEAINFSKENDIVVTAYSPLAKGRVKNNEVLNEVADDLGKTPSQIALRWLMEKNMVVIPKASSEKHLKENLEVLDFELDKDSLEKLNSSG